MAVTIGARSLASSSPRWRVRREAAQQGLGRGRPEQHERLGPDLAQLLIEPWPAGIDLEALGRLVDASLPTLLELEVLDDVRRCRRRRARSRPCPAPDQARRLPVLRTACLRCPRGRRAARLRTRSVRASAPRRTRSGWRRARGDTRGSRRPPPAGSPASSARAERRGVVRLGGRLGQRGLLHELRLPGGRGPKNRGARTRRPRPCSG